MSLIITLPAGSQLTRHDAPAGSDPYWHVASNAGRTSPGAPLVVGRDPFRSHVDGVPSKIESIDPAKIPTSVVLGSAQRLGTPVTGPNGTSGWTIERWTGNGAWNKDATTGTVQLRDAAGTSAEMGLQEFLAVNGPVGVTVAGPQGRFDDEMRAWLDGARVVVWDGNLRAPRDQQRVMATDRSGSGMERTIADRYAAGLDWLSTAFERDGVDGVGAPLRVVWDTERAANLSTTSVGRFQVSLSQGTSPFRPIYESDGLVANSLGQLIVDAELHDQNRHLGSDLTRHTIGALRVAAGDVLGSVRDESWNVGMMSPARGGLGRLPIRNPEHGLQRSDVIVQTVPSDYPSDAADFLTPAFDATRSSQVFSKPFVAIQRAAGWDAAGQALLGTLEVLGDRDEPLTPQLVGAAIVAGAGRVDADRRDAATKAAERAVRDAGLQE